jgi:hypothetical protein
MSDSPFWAYSGVYIKKRRTLRKSKDGLNKGGGGGANGGEDDA